MQNDSGAAKMITSITHAIFSFEGLLVLATPLLAFAYRVIKQFGMWDRLVGRDRALEGLKRLRSTAGYPASWLYDNEANANTYEAVYTRLKKNCKETKIKKLLDDGLRPALIATAGSPIEIKGVPPEWPQEARFFYPDNQPVLVVFTNTATPPSSSSFHGKGDKAFTLGDLSSWLAEEKELLDFAIGSILFGSLAMLVAVFRILYNSAHS
jgi:hypothetical protein